MTIIGATATDDKNSVANQALSLDGINDYIDSEVNLQSSGESSCAIRIGGIIDSLSHRNTVFTTVGASTSNRNGVHLAVFENTGDVYLTQYRSNSAVINVNTGFTCSIDTYYEFVLTYDASTNTFKLYVNGELEYSTTVGTAWSSSNENIWFGNYGQNTTNRFWEGMMDEPRTYNTVLSASEVATLYILYDQEDAPTQNNALLFGTNF